MSRAKLISSFIISSYRDMKRVWISSYVWTPLGLIHSPVCSVQKCAVNVQHFAWKVAETNQNRWQLIFFAIMWSTYRCSSSRQSIEGEEVKSRGRLQMLQTDKKVQNIRWCGVFCITWTDNLSIRTADKCYDMYRYWRMWHVIMWHVETLHNNMTSL